MKVIDVDLIVSIVFVLYIVIIIYIKFIRPGILMIKKIRYYDSLLKYNNLNEFIEKINDDINKAKSETAKSILNSTKMLGLLMLGEWETFFRTAQQVNVKLLGNVFETYHFGIYSLGYYLNNDIQNANRIYMENHNRFELFMKKSGYKGIKEIIQTISSVKCYFDNDFIKCENLFTLMHEYNPTNFFKAIECYYLALISMKNDGSIKQTSDYLVQAIEYGKGTVIEQYAKNLKENYEV